MQKQCVALRMPMATGEAGRSLDDPRVYTGPEGWLIGERPRGETVERIEYYWSNLPTDMPRERVAAHVRARWPIEPLKMPRRNVDWAMPKGGAGTGYTVTSRW